MILLNRTVGTNGKTAASSGAGGKVGFLQFFNKNNAFLCIFRPK